MEKISIPLSIDFEGIQFTGWATPSDQTHPDGLAGSYHVVLNQTFFGDMSFQNGKWSINEQRPTGLVQAAGEALSTALSIEGTGIQTGDQG